MHGVSNSRVDCIPSQMQPIQHSCTLYWAYIVERERESVWYVCVCVHYTSSDKTLIDWPLTSQLFLIPLSVQRGAKPKKVLHVFLTSLNVDHPTHTTAPPRAAACCQTLLLCVTVCVCTPHKSVLVWWSPAFWLEEFVISCIGV